MDLSPYKLIPLVRGWIDFLNKQDSPFKVNILKNFAQRFSANLTYQYQPIFLTSLGASPLILGYLNSINGLVNTILAIPTGIVADRMGIQKVLLMTLLLSVVSSVVFLFSSSWEIAAVALVLSGTALILDRTVCPMICGSCLASAERLTGMGICDTISFFPQLIAPILGAFMITLFGGMNTQGIRPLFIFQTIGMAIAFAIIWFKFKDPPTKSRGNIGSIFSGIKVVLREGLVVKRWILLTIVAAFPWQVMFYTPLFAAQVKGANQFVLGGMSAASTIVFVFFAIPLGHLSDTIGRKKVASFAAIVVCLSYLTLVFSTSDLMLLLSGFLSGFMMSFVQNLMAISVDLVPSKHLGSWYGIQGFCRGLIGIVSPIMCGYLWSLISPSSVFIFLAGMQLLSLIVLLMVPTKITR